MSPVNRAARVIAPGNQKVLLYFTSIDLEDCCNCDYVTILNGYYSYSNILTKGFGNILSPPVTSSGKYLYIHVSTHDLQHLCQVLAKLVI